MTAGAAPGKGRGAPDLLARAEAAVRRARERLLGLQRDDGTWRARLEASAGAEAARLLADHLLGRAPRPERDTRLAARLRARQGADGGWPCAPGGRGDPSATVEACLALVLAGAAADEPALVRARDFVRGHGGLAHVRATSRVWLATVGLVPWEAVPAFPVELVLAPPWVPLGIHGMSAFARAHVVPLALLSAERPPARAELAARAAGLAFDDVPAARTAVAATRRSLLSGLGALERSPWKPLRRRAVARAIDWVLCHQDGTGLWAGMERTTVWSLLALHAVGFALDHAVVMRGVQALDDLLADDGDTLVAAPAATAVRDTAGAAGALLAAGLEPGHPALGRAGAWLVERQARGRGDWAVARPRLEPGGWAAAPADDWYPATDDTAAVLEVLGALPIATTPAGRRALAYGTNWALGMQWRSGGFAACDADNAAPFLEGLAFADGLAVVDVPSADVTGRVLGMAGRAGYDMGFGRVRRAAAFLRETQRADGSWGSRWGVDFLHGTWRALGGLAAVGEDLGAPHVRRAVDWLVTRQNPDGGWGEGVGSFEDETLAGSGDSTPSQTAWALMGLLAAGDAAPDAVEGGVAYLVDAQDDDGGWTEDAFTATLVPRHLYVRSDLAPLVFPLTALGRFIERARRRAGGSA